MTNDDKLAILENISDKIDAITNLSIECSTILYLAGWNAAIEAAASALDDIGQSKHTLESTIYHQQLANKIRKLKK